MRARLLLAFLMAMIARPGVAEDLVLALSTREVAITSTYTGAEITVFGLIERDARSISRSGIYDIAITVQGPPGDLLMQSKGPLGPIWLTQDRQRYAKIPLFFSVLTSRPVADFADEALRERLKLGLDHYLPRSSTELVPDQRLAEFNTALLRLKAQEGSIIEDAKAVTMIRPNLFTGRITLPATAPVGLYIVNVSLVQDGIPLKTVQGGFVVRKVGFDAFVAAAAREKGWIYGIVVLALAGILGWFANIVFRKE